MYKYLLILFSSVVLCHVSYPQRTITDPSINVLHYQFSIALNDENDNIKGEAVISFACLKNVSSIDFDLSGKNKSGRGMTVNSVKKDDKNISFKQESEVLHINATGNTGQTIDITIDYEGIPATGLIIDKNKYGHRTFFGDNWPNRAHCWLPCVDHPSDKAAVDFIVTAPDHYQVVGNGIQVEETNLPSHLKLTHWKETAELPMKVMAIGVADFAVNYAGNADSIPVYSWVYPEDRDKGFFDYALAKDILPFFMKNVGPYAFRKLANVQSKTQFGGMENASAIFYFENSIKGDRKLESLLTHEIAHQWFGNSATETNWQHIWLSEGFATYMTHLYLENKYGVDSMITRLQQDRDEIIGFSKYRHTPVVDTTVTKDFMQLLNVNSYQKGGWVLHMLRRKLGDELFWQGIKKYYATYAGKNASTDDFRKVMETTSGKDLQVFFKQWLYTPGLPLLDVKWKYNEIRRTVTITAEQTQTPLFDISLQVALESGTEIILQNMNIKDKTNQLELPCAKKPTKLMLDPGVNVLFDARIRETD